MKALLKKELLLNHGFIWTIVIMLPLSYIINVGGVPVMTGVMFGYVIGLFYYDNQSGINKFVVSLPITRKDVINAKYVYSIIFMFVVFLYFFLVDKIAHMYLNYLNYEPINFSALLSFYLVTLMIIAIYIPFYIKFSFMTAFLFQLISMMVGPIAFFGLLNWIGTRTNIFDYIEDFVLSFVMFIQKNPFVVFVPLTIILLFISWFISQRIFMKKDLT